MNKKTSLPSSRNMFSIIFFPLFFGGLYYISGITGILNTILTLCIYSLIGYVFYILWKTIRKKDFLNFQNFLVIFLYKVSWGILLSIVIVGGLSYYKNAISPTPMPTYYLSNGEKEVIFQAMSHIGTQNFYNTIQKNLEEKKQEGYVYFFEGVKPGTQENIEKFNTAMGIKFDKNLYENFSKLYGVIHQDNSLFLNLINNKDFNIDLSIDEIMILYNESVSEENITHTRSILQDNEVLDINAEIIKTLAALNEKELSILRYINKALLNFMIGSEATQNLVMNNFANQKLFKIILGKRNKVLAQAIIDSANNKIFITYGLLHFQGVLDILQKDDKKWKIKEVEYLYPIN